MHFKQLREKLLQQLFKQETPRIIESHGVIRTINLLLESYPFCYIPTLLK